MADFEAPARGISSGLNKNYSWDSVKAFIFSTIIIGGIFSFCFQNNRKNLSRNNRWNPKNRWIFGFIFVLYSFWRHRVLEKSSVFFRALLIRVPAKMDNSNFYIFWIFLSSSWGLKHFFWINFSSKLVVIIWFLIFLLEGITWFGGQSDVRNYNLKNFSGNCGMPSSTIMSMFADGENICAYRYGDQRKQKTPNYRQMKCSWTINKGRPKINWKRWHSNMKHLFSEFSLYFIYSF